MLWVSNHVSWTDIPLLGMLTPLSFLSKAEVRHWPVAGWLAEKAGTLFIRRGGGDGQRLREQIAASWSSATAADLPRRHHHRWPQPAYLPWSPAGRCHRPRYPLAAGGDPVPARWQPDPIAPFIGDDDLVSHLMRLFGQDRGEVVIHLLRQSPAPTRNAPRWPSRPSRRFNWRCSAPSGRNSAATPGAQRGSGAHAALAQQVAESIHRSTSTSMAMITVLAWASWNRLRLV
jgi:hypothetical protein